jgi:hypothetical protein
VSPGLGDLVGDGGGGCPGWVAVRWGVRFRLACGRRGAVLAGGQLGGDGVNGRGFGDAALGGGVIGVTVASAARAAGPRAEGQEAQPRSWRVTW